MDRPREPASVFSRNRLESSGNLGEWQEAAQHTATATESSRDTTVPAGDPARFFRLVVLPP